MVGGVVVIVAFVLLQRRVGSAPVFYATFRTAIRNGAPSEQALRRTSEFFARRPPFSLLTMEDIDYIVGVGADLTDPEEIGQIWAEVDKRRDVRILKSIRVPRGLHRQCAPWSRRGGCTTSSFFHFTAVRLIFSGLTDDDVTYLVYLFLAFPAALGDAVMEADARGDASMLTDRPDLQGFRDHVARARGV